jgi:hypothetical protein
MGTLDEEVRAMMNFYPLIKDTNKYKFIRAIARYIIELHT